MRGAVDGFLEVDAMSDDDEEEVELDTGKHATGKTCRDGPATSQSGGEEEEESGARKPVKMQDPKEPSEEERREHELTHLPFRSWCRHCVRGRGKEKSCTNQAKEDGNRPEVHLDFMFMGEPEGGDRR